MSRSSTRDQTGSQSSRDRAGRHGAVEPTVALVAVFAVCAGMGLYAGVLDDAVAVAGSDRDRAGPAVDRLVDTVSIGGVADPDRLDGAVAALPGERRCNAALVTAHKRWGAGPQSPWSRAAPDAPNSSTESSAAAQSIEGGAVDVATRTVSVRLGPGRIVPGRLRVVVWA